VRAAGILLPIQSIPRGDAPGSLREASIRAIDAFASFGIGVWQILPLNPPDFVGSPYASPSAFAMDPELLHDLAGDVRDPSRYDLDAWLENSGWADSWALFRILKSIDPRSWVKWGSWSNPTGRDLDRLRSDNEEHYWREITIQWKLEYAMRSIENHARENGILMLGDIPLYVAHDSADIWHSKELFNIGPNGEPLERSGAPPDSFNPLGQLWGNPTYAWSAHQKSGYAWWKKRVETASRRTPGIRIDHFIGLAEYWAIPPEAEDARGGRWAEGPGASLMDAIIDSSDFLIAEDLGMAGDAAIRLRDAYNLHGMSILQFGWGHDAPPHHLDHIPERVVAYTGTHDNDTFAGWYSKIGPDDRRRVRASLGCNSADVPMEAVKRLISSKADIVVIPLQDVLGLGSSARINTPGLVSKRNWSWMAPEHWESHRSWAWLSESVKSSGRLPWYNGRESSHGH
tara:strand:+ start:712 stop:2082 length:1371 start_codon:yes stop_codon:yes gene_type:complete